MSATAVMKRIAEFSPRFRARITAAFYLLTIILGGLVLSFQGRFAFWFDLVASACYVAVTALFYDLSKPTNRSLLMDRGGLRPHALKHGEARPAQAEQRL
jgi:hypothetical protein